VTGNRDRPSSDRDGVSCEIWREALSARLDGEEPPAGATDVDGHLASCPECAAYAGDLDALHRATRLRPAEEVPDLTDAILAQAPASSRRPHRRSGVLVAAIVPLVLVVCALGWWAARPDPFVAPELRYASGYATAGPSGGTAAVYLSLTNDGGADDLVGAETLVAERATLHSSEHRDGFVLMSNRDDYPVPANGAVTFQPGGAHLMLEGLDRPLATGDQVELVLHFNHSPSLTVTATVVPLTEITDLVGIDPAADTQG
jgi:copper(I)-binding protein